MFDLPNPCNDDIKSNCDIKKNEIVEGVCRLTCWWLSQRIQKIRQADHGTMEVNPFMSPLVSALHGHDDFEELAEFLLGGHFSIGHATGFGKLIDEKILPEVFGTMKLGVAARSGIFRLSCFDNIDHIVKNGTETTLLSLKAGKWTIQLGQAVQLNRSFSEINDLMSSNKYPEGDIIVGAFYGKEENLTDKYRLIRGISKGANHDVVDLTKRVRILSGAKFWEWIGQDSSTQQWVLEGILKAIDDQKVELEEAKALLAKYKSTFASQFEAFCKNDEEIDWQGILKKING